MGYFDPSKCYSYEQNTAANEVTNDPSKGDQSYFKPRALTANHKCDGVASGRWSGNFLNWAVTAAIDPFRWAMTGGNRIIDTTETILQKNWQGNRGLFDDRALTASEIAGATPYDRASQLTVSVANRGFVMQLTSASGSMKAVYFNNMTLAGSPCSPSITTTHFTTGAMAAQVLASTSTAFSTLYRHLRSSCFRRLHVSGHGRRRCKLWVNNNLVVANGWKDQGATAYTATVNLISWRQLRRQGEYYENGGGAVMKLEWARPGAYHVQFVHRRYR